MIHSNSKIRIDKAATIADALYLKNLNDLW